VLNASIVIDGGPPVFFSPPVQTAAVTTNNLIFTSGDLPGNSSGNWHQLVVTAENNFPIWADYMLISPAVSSSSPSGSSTPSTGSTQTAVIIGAAVGGAALFILIVAAAFFCLCRRKRRPNEVAALPLSHVMTPFSEFIGSSVEALRTPFTSSHPYTPLPKSDVKLSSASTSGHSSSGHSTAMHGSIPYSKRAAQGSGSAAREDAPPRYTE